MTLSVKECLSYGWRTFKARPWFFVRISLLLMLIQFGINFVTGVMQKPLELMPDDPSALMVSLAAVVISLVAAFLIQMGQTRLFLAAHDDVATAQAKHLWAPNPFWKFVGTSMLVFVLVLFGLILLIVPGIILGLMFTFTTYLVMDRKLGPITALKESARITKGNRWNLLLLGLACLGVNILGFLALLVGLFVTVPVTMLAAIHAYRTLGQVAMVSSESVAAA